MAAPRLLAADFVTALQALMPRGRAWPRDPDAVMTDFLGGLAPAFERQSGRAADLLIDAFPSTTFELLPEWEATLGLPDPCAGEAPTVSQRVAQVKARFAFQGGQSKPFYIAFAAALGYSITITEFSQTHTTGYTSAESPPTGAEWAHTWQVACADITSRVFLLGVDTCGEQFATSDGAEVLKCELNRIKPAHTRLVFASL